MSTAKSGAGKPPLAAAPTPALRSRHRPSLLRPVSDVAWRLLVVVITILAGVYALSRVWFVVLPVFIALLLSALLVPVVTRLEARRWPPLAATWLAFGGFLGMLVAIVSLIAPAVADEFSGLGQTVSEGVDSVERWLVDGPLGLEQDQLERYRGQAGQLIGDSLRSSSKAIATGAKAVAEGIAGVVLALVLSFFFIKDGRRFQRWALAHVPVDRQDLVSALAGRAWRALSGYLRGAALIGLLEGVVIGLTLWLVGAKLAVPVAVLTFFGAFFPLVGAIAAGIIATLVALVSGGTAAALIVAAVALVVQQFDNDLLAPLIYGRAISLHPAVVLIVLAGGSALGGIIGAFLAVPVAAMVSAVGNEVWSRYGEQWRAPVTTP